MKTKKWKDISIGDILEDGSVVTQVHPTHKQNSYKIVYGKTLDNESIILSEDHMLLCDIRKIDKKEIRNILKHFEQTKIPIEVDYILDSEKELKYEDKLQIETWLKEGKTDMPKIMNDIIINQVPVDTHDVIVYNKGLFGLSSTLQNQKYDKFKINNLSCDKYKIHKNSILIWLTMDIIHKLVNMNFKIYCNNKKILNSYYQGEKYCKCISTDTGLYNVKHLIHHNSVTLRSIIFHALTHSYDVSICLTDLKQTEFTQFKGVNGVVAVCNSVAECVEALRIGREIMKKRNLEMAKLGITDINDYVPNDPTDKIWISGRELNENELVEIDLNGEIKKITAKELLELAENS